MPAGFGALIAAQFASSLADNALLIITMALLHRRGLPAWWAPLLKLGFTVSYVVFAPVLGPLADAVPKARLMLWMTGVKVAGVAGMVAGLNPIVAFCIVGFGASAYAPAKYGLVTEIVGERQLVAANGWLEVTVVVAVLLGTALGGALAAPGWLDHAGAALPAAFASGPTGRLTASFAVLLAVYLASALLTWPVPDSGSRYAARSIRPLALWSDFFRSNATLWRDGDGGLSLAATTIFWGAGATLQFVVLRWATHALHMPLYHAAYLQATVAIGVVAGAAVAGRCVALSQAKRMLGCGIVLGLMLPALALVSSLTLAIPLLLAAGALGGLMVVPLNALLQQRGCVLLSAGRSIAVQGFNENASILVMLAIYAGAIASGLSIEVVMWGLGVLIAASIGLLMSYQQVRRRALAAAGSGAA
jgi:MFS family permease